MNKPLVSIIMGSDSDLPVIKDAAVILEEFSVPYEMTIVSAHRSPDLAAAYAKRVASRGVKVVIAGAGGAAHLAGVTAALTTIPVIGIPVKAKSLEGLDSLLSVVQMPPGIPVATVGINAATNAGLLAVEILATNNAGLTKKLVAYKQKLQKGVSDKAEKLEKGGYASYLESMKK